MTYPNAVDMVTTTLSLKIVEQPPGGAYLKTYHFHWFLKPFELSRILTVVPT